MQVDQELELIEQLLQRGEVDEAQQKLEALEPGDQSRSFWWLIKGKLLFRQGEYTEACTHLEKAIELDDDNTEAVFQLAYLADLLGDDERAIELYESCIQDPPMHVNAMINLAVIYEDLGDYEQAETYLCQILEHFPNHERAKLFLKDVESSMHMHYDEELERNREKQSAILDIPISDFELSVRSRNCLKKMNINTLGDLLRTTEAELLSYKNFGETSLNEIKAMLSQKGLRLGQALEEGSFKAGAAIAAAEDSPAGDPTLLNKPVSELELSVRARKCLQRLGIATLGELASKTESELLSSKNFGQTSLAEIRLRLAESGLSLRKVDGRS